MQTILGAGGAIGTLLARDLHKYSNAIRLAGRHPKAVIGDEELVVADITNAGQVDKAVAGSSVVYLTVGFEYNTKVWATAWPQAMHNAIAACEKHSARLVFFDNIYMHDPKYLDHMTEETPHRPCSKKGRIRASIAEQFMQAVQQGRIEGLIARSADFYGPNCHSSVLQELVYKNLKKGKTPQWFVDADQKHSFTYTPDAASATALLGNTPDAFGQVWHLPTDPNTLTGREWVALFAQTMRIQESQKIQIVSPLLTRLLGLFIPVLRESYEMLYQYQKPYFFDSSKFTAHFGIAATSYKEGVGKVIGE